MTPGRDLEMNELHASRSLAEGASSYTVSGHGSGARDSRRLSQGFRGATNRFIDSFRREDGYGRGPDGNVEFQVTGADGLPTADNGFGTPLGVHVAREHRGARYYDLKAANAKTASSLLTRELKGRHLQMIAIGGSIGTGLFVASGRTLSQGGPASVLLAYMFIGVMLYCTVHALGEMAVVFPVAGSFSAFSTRFLDPSWGFAMGWK